MRCRRDKKVTQYVQLNKKLDHEIGAKTFLKIMHQLITRTSKLFKSHKKVVLS